MSGNKLLFVILLLNITVSIYSIIVDNIGANAIILVLSTISLIVFQLKIVNPISILKKEVDELSEYPDNSADDIQFIQNSLSSITKSLTDKIYWYEQLLDTIPFPISVTDMDMNWTFINKPVASIIGKERKDVIGKEMQCSNWNADICNTERCGIAMLNAGKTTSWFNQPGLDMDFQVDTSFLYDKDGNKIGHIEVVQDITENNRLKQRLEYGTNLLLSELEKFASGDLSSKIEDNIDDQVGKLLKGYVKAISNVRELIENVNEAVSATASASTQISSSSEEMAAGSQEQSSQASEVAVAVEEMTRTILETTQNSSRAAQKSKDAGEIAIEGGKVVKETVSGMNRISEVVKESAEIVRALGQSSDQIGAIIQVINEIADQTNLLALNAAIEAARAGEHGRGFAVVADEVRKLAERTTGATQEIADMIKKIQKDTSGAVESIELGTQEVEKGKILAEKAGASLNEIIKGTNEVMDVVAQVAAASEEQSATSEQISKNIDGISRVAQESALGVDQIARASDELNQLTENLLRIVSNFKLGDKGKNYLVRQNGSLIES